MNMREETKKEEKLKASLVLAIQELLDNADYFQRMKRGRITIEIVNYGEKAGNRFFSMQDT
jgi:hypothetical protein